MTPSGDAPQRRTSRTRSGGWMTLRMTVPLAAALLLAAAPDGARPEASGAVLLAQNCGLPSSPAYQNCLNEYKQEQQREQRPAQPPQQQQQQEQERARQQQQEQERAHQQLLQQQERA